MSETSHTPSPAPSPPPERVHVASPDRRRVDLLPLMYLMGFLVLGGALFYLWRNPAVPDALAHESPRLEALQRQVQDLSARVDARLAIPPVNLAPIEGRLASLESRPVTPPVNLAPVEGRLAALEARPAPPAPGTQMSLTDVAGRLDALSGRLDALTGRLNGELGALTGRLNAEFAPLPGRVEDLGTALDTKLAALRSELGGRVDGLGTDLDGKLATLRSELGGRVEGLGTDLNGKLSALRSELGGRVEGLGTDLNGKLSALGSGVDGKLGQIESRLSAAEQRLSQSGQQVSGIVDRATRLARLQAAAVALETGQKLGDIPGAPPALARFAGQAPPTEAALRLSFPAAAEAAHKASQPAIEENQPLLNRTWIRAQQFVTLRQGDRVLVGDPIAGVLARARELLDAGDLQGALQALDGLAGPAAEAMQPWRAQAQALVDARAALAAQTAGAR